MISGGGVGFRPSAAQDGLTRQDVADQCRATLMKLVSGANKLGPTEDGQSLPLLSKLNWS